MIRYPLSAEIQHFSASAASCELGYSTPLITYAKGNTEQFFMRSDNGFWKLSNEDDFSDETPIAPEHQGKDNDIFIHQAFGLGVVIKWNLDQPKESQ